MKKCILYILLLTLVVESNAQWSSSSTVNTPVCAPPGSAASAFHSIEDGQGGMYIAWSDARSIFSSGTKIYAQHIDSNGYELWTPNGLLICGVPQSQSHPFIAFDQSNGGCIISWTDERSTYKHVYAQRLSSSGVPKWTSGGIKVTGSLSIDQDNLTILSDGMNGGAILFFRNEMGLYSKQVRAQRIDSLGNLLWMPDGQVLIDSANSIDESSCCVDGLGGAYYAWIEKTVIGNLNTRTMFGHVNSIGGIINTGVVSQVSNVNSSYFAPKVVPDLQGNAIVCWSDNRAQILDKDQIFVQKINAFGVGLWTTNGIDIGLISSLYPEKYNVVADGSNGVIIAWLDGNSMYTNKEVRAQRITSGGIKSWPSNGSLLCDTLYAKNSIGICTNHSNGAFVSWRQSDIGDAFYHLKIVGQQVNFAGIPQWNNAGVTEVYNQDCANGNSYGSNFYMLPDKKQGAMLAFIFPCFSIGEIRVQNICSSGYLACTPPDIKVSGNQIVIPSGSETSSLSNLSDFGSDTLLHSITHLFKVQNLGTSTLNISNIEINGQHASSFSYTILNTSLTFDSTILAISFSPKTAGLNSARIIITSNDLDEGSYSFVVHGYGINFVHQAEYFWDTDPGLGNGIPFNAFPSSDSINLLNVVSTIGVKSGYHYLFIRTRDIAGRWSISEGREIYIQPTIVAMQYFVDTDPGFANGIEIPILPTNDSINVNVAINTNGLSYGEHWVYTRTKNSDGEYALSEGRKIVVRKALVAAEYFVDNDPGQGNGFSIPITIDTTINFTGNIQLPLLATGLHKLFIRTLDQEGFWSHPEIRQFYVTPPNQQVDQIVAAEFYIDNEPGQGLGTSFGIMPGNVTNFSGNIILPTIATGLHTMHIRVQDQVGKWSHVEQRKFYCNPPNYPANDIVSAEYFFDSDPGYNQALPILLSAGATSLFNGSVSVPVLSTGIHILNLRTKDELGKWSQVERRTMFVKPFDPATQIVAAEYYIDNDPGQGNAASIFIPVPNPTIQHCGSITLPTLTTGTHKLFVRTKDNRNIWSLQEPRTMSTIANANVSIIPNSNITICLPDTVQLIANTNNGFTTYQWYRNCEAINGATTSTYQANSIGNYYVIVSNGTQSQSASVTISEGSCQSIVQLKCFIEGYWNGGALMQSAIFNQGVSSMPTACDSIEVELHDVNAPYAKLYTTSTLLMQDGTAVCEFPALNGSYYLVVQHRNAIETWSANPIMISANTSYDFTTSSSQAFGDNMKEVDLNVWAFFAGDVNQDENIDLLDAASLENDINAFQFGYFATDINGDGNVDLLDAPIVESNINAFIFSNHP